MDSKKRRDSSHSVNNELLDTKRITGKELTDFEEISARLSTLVDMLDRNGNISKKEYERTVAMRLHEISKASAFDEMDEEI
jgi:hypothetical protein